VLFSSRNGSYHVVRPRQVGDTLAKSTFVGVAKVRVMNVLSFLGHWEQDSTFKSMNYIVPGGVVIGNDHMLTIFDVLTVFPPVAVVPLIDQDGHSFVYQLEVPCLCLFTVFLSLQATGGSGFTHWTSSDLDVVAVNTQGEITSVALGHTRVRLSDKRNTLHFDDSEVKYVLCFIRGNDISQVYVAIPSSMRFLPAPIETTVDQELHVPFGIFDEVFLCLSF
jgi:hypothetical protein